MPDSLKDLLLRDLKLAPGECTGKVIFITGAGQLRGADLAAVEAERPLKPVLGTQHVDPQPAVERMTASMEQLRRVLSETAAEFEKLPAFTRPLARGGFKSKSGASLDDWQRMLEKLSTNPAGWQQSVPALTARLEKLVAYYTGVPAETARFTRDKAFLAEITWISSERIAVIRELIDALK